MESLRSRSSIFGVTPEQMLGVSPEQMFEVIPELEQVCGEPLFGVTPEQVFGVKPGAGVGVWSHSGVE